jgi:hypothetical protein
MPTTYKVLGQSYPTANTDTALYTVPSSTSAVISTVSICNIGTAEDAVFLSIRPNGETLANKHYVLFNELLSAGQNLSLTLGITLGDTDVVTIKSANGTCSFNAFGTEL